MSTIVLDAGAFVANERWDQTVRAWIDIADEENLDVIVPAAVIAEIWRTPPRTGSVRLLGGADTVVPLDLARAKSVGSLLGRAGATHVVDAAVAEVAMANQPAVILTSDVDDIAQLLTAANAQFAVGEERNAPILIITV